MLYRESGQYKTSYAADMALFPIRQDRIGIAVILLLAFVAIPALGSDFLLDAVGHWPKERPIVTLCACPEDAGAVQAARRLLEAGYLSVRPVKGGYEAWLAAVAKA